MRTCLSYFVVEQIRQGMSPKEACVLGIQRMMELECSSNDDSSDSSVYQHPKLTVGVIAMDKYGNVSFTKSTENEALDLTVFVFCTLIVFTLPIQRWGQHQH
jgi:isoaspartyl peptidase/L-asparaginase-like protein (Ntn-hydrolase superfamily)